MKSFLLAVCGLLLAQGLAFAGLFGPDNASGEVAGNSITINSHPRGFSLSPVFP